MPAPMVVNVRPQDAVRRWKSIQGCADCGCRDLEVLECDHDGENKRANIADLRSRAALAEELKKVTVRCVRCHRQVTAARLALADQEIAELDEIAAAVDCDASGVNMDR